MFGPQERPLTEQEIKIVRLMAQGLKSKEIGEQVGLAARTVIMRSQLIYDALGMWAPHRNKAAAVARAIALGVIEVDEIQNHAGEDG